MISVRRLLPLIAFFAASPLLAQQANEFDLETTTPRPSATTGAQVQGPVDDSGIVPVGPRRIGPSPTPTATATPGPRPVPTAAPSPSPAPRQQAPSVSQPRQAAQPSQAGEQATTATASRPEPDAASPIPQASEPVPSGQSATDPIPSSGETPPSQSDTDAAIPGLSPVPTGSSEISAQAATGDAYWWWVLAALVAAIAAVAGFAFYKRRQPVAITGGAGTASRGLMKAATPRPNAEAPPAEMAGPETASPPASARTATPAPVAPPIGAGSPVAPLGLETHVVRMQRSMMGLTVTARVAVTNRGSKAITNAVLQGDLVGANNGEPLGQQLASAAAELDQIEALGTIEPGERREVTANVRIDLNSLKGIRQGGSVVYVPLLRLRFSGDGTKPLASTVMVGHPPAQHGGKPTPFPAQAAPQIYDNVVGRALG
ncbi:hypothetical protein PF049_05750 [Erythrobacteraceae bacterium WH01K]|nr:hypothetical protein PF049_05750 [Erythrobacteraceae bacterium WH01K]